MYRPFYPRYIDTSSFTGCKRVPNPEVTRTFSSNSNLFSSLLKRRQIKWMTYGTTARWTRQQIKRSSEKRDRERTLRDAPFVHRQRQQQRDNGRRRLFSKSIIYPSSRQPSGRFDWSNLSLSLSLSDSVFSRYYRQRSCVQRQKAIR